jgi:hypothetical protein
VEHESLNAADGSEGARRWAEAGRPVLPTLVVDGQALPVLHVSQIAEALGLPSPPGDPGRDAPDAAAILEAWIGELRNASWEALLTPTPARGRSLRELTVNVFHPFELLPAAWSTGEFDWRPEEDWRREDALPSLDDLLDFATAAAAGWSAFLSAEDVAARDTAVVTSRGLVSFSALVSFQRWHAAYHYRQLVDVLGVDGLELATFEGLTLPRDVF